MYAARRLHVKQWKHQSADERYTVKLARGGKPVRGIRANRISDVEEEVMYWRKANHIHAWFVDNVQDGQDDCRSYYVDWGKLNQLLEVCQRVIAASRLVKGSVLVSKVWNSKHKTWDERREPGRVIEDPTVAKELLPTRKGFFFGSYEYDEHYLDDVYETHAWAKRMLADQKAGVPGDIYYASSW